MFELSPRETDILGYLARGRNAAYLKDKLNISPHTVKSHIYSIYRKFDIHSQQKLMDFIEEYPLTDAELKKYASGDGGEERELISPRPFPGADATRYPRPLVPKGRRYPRPLVSVPLALWVRGFFYLRRSRHNTNGMIPRTAHQ